MSIHCLPRVSADPIVTLKPWLVVECDDGQRYIMGYRVDDLEGRVSTPVVEFDRVAMTVRTRSGRTYRLEGPPGIDADALYVWRAYASINKLVVVRDVTADYYDGWHGIPHIVDTRGEMVVAALQRENRLDSPAPETGSAQTRKSRPKRQWPRRPRKAA